MAEEQQTEQEVLESMRVSLEGAEQDTPKEGEDTGDDTPQYTDTEKQAMEMGWNPEGVEGKRNVSAEEFIDRKSLFDRIHKLERGTKDSQKVIDALKKYNEQIAEKAYERAVNDLKQQKFEALENQEHARVLELDDEIEKMRAEKPKVVEVEETPAYTPEEWDSGFKQFANENVWYGRRPEMTKAADDIGTAYVQANPDISPDELFAYVQGEINNKYKDFFESGIPKQPKVAPAGGNRGPAKGAQKKSIKDIPEEDREVALTLIRSGHITEEEYVKSYFGE